ncbi:MAG TPA: hypothetical protein VGA24_10990, partial [Steroidobacteraceae bacterium]
MTTIRPRSLSGLLSAALLLIVLPLTMALVYGGVQLRQLSRTSEVLVRDSITLTQHMQVLFQDIAAMQRRADYFRLLSDPRIAAAFDADYVAFTRTLMKVAEYVPASDIERVRAAGEATADLVRRVPPGNASSALVERFAALGAEANRLADEARLGIDSRLSQVERKASATQQGLLWAIMALVPGALAIAGIFWFY